MKLSDHSIAQLVRVLQLAILTGTDVTDNIRMMQFIEEEGYLVMDPEYLGNFDVNLTKLQDALDGPTTSGFDSHISVEFKDDEDE